MRLPRTKSRVPSMGSMIQRRPESAGLPAPSSPRMPSAGKLASNSCTKSRSQWRSAAVTGDSSLFESAFSPVRQ